MPSNDIRIVLSGAAKAAHDQMLEATRSDSKTSINSSQLINWIVEDYFQKLFKKRQEALCRAHFNERKCLLEAMKIEDPESRRKALQEAARYLKAPMPRGREASLKNSVKSENSVE